MEGLSIPKHIAAGIRIFSIVMEFLSGRMPRGATAQQAAAFEHFHVPAGVFEFERGGKPRKAAAHDRYTGRSQDSNTTCSFSPFESAARSCSGNSASRSILRSKRS